MRAIGGAERAFDLMCQRAITRVTHGSPLADKGIIQHWIATSRMEIDQARLLMLHAAWKMDKFGKHEARQEISMIKTVAANTFQQGGRPLDADARSTRVHGGYAAVWALGLRPHLAHGGRPR